MNKIGIEDIIFPYKSTQEWIEEWHRKWIKEQRNDGRDILRKKLQKIRDVNE